VRFSGEERTGTPLAVHRPGYLVEFRMRERVPMVGDIDYCWSGQIMEPYDGLAFIGHNLGDKNVFVATSTSGNGMTYGMIAAMILSDLIAGRDNPWAKLYGNPWAGHPRLKTVAIIGRSLVVAGEERHRRQGNRNGHDEDGFQEFAAIAERPSIAMEGIVSPGWVFWKPCQVTP
jgi:hypothetical protein